MKVQKQTSRWEDAGHLRIEPEEITYLVQEMARRHDEDGEADFFASFAILMGRYEGHEDAADRIYSITARMRCLAELMQDERMRGWTMKTEDLKCTLTNAAVFHAVALCTLQIKDERFYFEPDEFFRIALEKTEPEGCA